MKDNDTHNRPETASYGLRSLRYPTTSPDRKGGGVLPRRLRLGPVLFVPALTPAPWGLRNACMMCLFLCLLTSSAIADTSSAPPDANSPLITGPDYTQPGDANTPPTSVQTTQLQTKPPPDSATDSNAVQSSSPQDFNKPKGADWLIAKTPTTDLARNLWRDRMSVPKNPEENNTKEQLQQLINRIRAIEFKPPEPVYKPVVTVTPISQIEPNLTAVEPADQNLIDVQQTQKTGTKPQPGAVSNETLNTLIERLQKPELLKNPFELGEILSNAGCTKEAAVCYSQALTRIDPNLPDPTGKKPWILFQIGNCLRKDNPPKALEAYSQLINEHAGSLWTDLAKAQSSLINWRRQDMPKMLIEESRPKPTDNEGPPDFIITTESLTKTEQQKRG